MTDPKSITSDKSWEAQAVDEIIAKEQEIEALDKKIARYQFVIGGMFQSPERQMLETRMYELLYERSELCKEVYGDDIS